MRDNRAGSMETIQRCGRKAARYESLIVAFVLFCVVAGGCARQAETAPAADAAKSGKGSTETGGVTIPSLPEEYRAAIMEADPEWLTWCDRLREVFAALPATAQETMLETNEDSFRLADLPPEEAAVIQELLEEHVPTRQWVENHTEATTPADYAGLKFIFGRLNVAEESVRFIIESPQGDRMQPTIGGWPETPAKPQDDDKDDR